tara:strand:+ start:499 stop:687 length:189 start_codon:yes stop_codon:yes gene_type:complete
MSGNARSKLRKCNVCGRKAITNAYYCNPHNRRKGCEGILEIADKNPNKNIKKLGDLYERNTR